MISKLMLELEVLPIDELESKLTEKSMWIYATDITKSYVEWEHIRVWKEVGGWRSGPRWSTDSSDIKYERDGLPPYTHYIILPNLCFS